MHVSRRSLRARALFAGVAVVALAGLAPGCTKEKESLILLSLAATDGGGGSIVDVTITLNGPLPSTNFILQRIFNFPNSGLPMTPEVAEFGIYVPADIKGVINIDAVAHPETGCAGYAGRGSIKVNGGDSPGVTIMMRARDVCGAGGAGGGAGQGGSGMGGGAGGTTGAGGSTVVGCGTSVGTPPPTVGPPSLASCVEFDHNPGVACDPSVSGINNQFINDLAVSPDGTLLATSASDIYGDGSVKIWRFQGNTPVLCGPMYSMSVVAPAFLAFSPDGQYLALAWNGYYIDVYRVPSFTYVGLISSSFYPLVGVGFSPDSQTVFSLDWAGFSGGTLYADRPTGEALAAVELSVDVDALAVSPVAGSAGLPIAVVATAGDVLVYNWTGGAFSGPTMLTAGTADAWGVRFSPDGQLLAVGSADGVVRFWSAPFTSNVTTGTQLNLGSGTVWQLSFAPGGTFLAAAFGGEVDIWNVSTRAFVARRNLTVPAGATSTTAFAVSFSASGGAIVGGGSKCGKLIVCND
jgi:hypothetical protein